MPSPSPHHIYMYIYSFLCCHIFTFIIVFLSFYFLTSYYTHLFRYQLKLKCWSYAPEDRPSSCFILEQLEMFYQRLLEESTQNKNATSKHQKLYQYFGSFTFFLLFLVKFLYFGLFFILMFCYNFLKKVIIFFSFVINKNIASLKMHLSRYK